MNDFDSRQLIAKLDDIEMKLAFQDDLLNSLNDVVTRQDKEIRDLWTANKLLKQNMNELKSESTEVESESPPPHY
jgi:SlyX protein